MARYHLLPILGIPLAWAVAVQAQVPSDEELRSSARERLGVIEPVSAAERESPEARLGQALFWDTRLSSDGETACASCHFREGYGSDTRHRSIDANGQPTGLHSTSVLNAQQATVGLRWLADRDTGAEQAMGSVTGSMGFDEPQQMLSILRSDAEYPERFEEAFPDDPAPISLENYGQALETYQRTLRTPAPFDRWLDGDDGAMDQRQVNGLQRFMEMGCASCHNGPLVGGSSLQRFGVVDDYWKYTGVEEPHEGLMIQTGREQDRYRFRVSPLRNVAETAPYFHDGSVEELSEAVNIMATVQLGQELTARERQELRAFLEALTGELPENFAPLEGIPFTLPEGL